MEVVGASYTQFIESIEDDYLERKRKERYTQCMTKRGLINVEYVRQILID